MVNDYSGTASTLGSTGRYEQVAFSQKEYADPNKNTKENFGVALAQQGKTIRTREESPVIGAN